MCAWWQAIKWTEMQRQWWWQCSCGGCSGDGTNKKPSNAASTFIMIVESETIANRRHRSWMCGFIRRLFQHPTYQSTNQPSIHHPCCLCRSVFLSFSFFPSRFEREWMNQRMTKVKKKKIQPSTDWVVWFLSRHLHCLRLSCSVSDKSNQMNASKNEREKERILNAATRSEHSRMRQLGRGRDRETSTV